jgi:hypothetical protein
MRTPRPPRGCRAIEEKGCRYVMNMVDFAIDTLYYSGGYSMKHKEKGLAHRATSNTTHTYASHCLNAADLRTVI